MGLALFVGHLAAETRAAEARLPGWVRAMPRLKKAVLATGLPRSPLAADIQRFRSLDKCLANAGLARHDEPANLPDTELFSCEMWGYSGLHHLRRLAAYTALGRALYVPSRQLDDDDPVVAEYDALIGEGDVSELPFQHLMLHGDSEGMYLPQDFKRVLDPGRRYFSIVGGGIGSVHRLQGECRALAQVLELPLNLDVDAPDLWSAADAPGQGDEKWRQFGIESFSCLRLVVACERAIATGAALVYC
jgi:hypothetical protein